MKSPRISGAFVICLITMLCAVPISNAQAIATRAQDQSVRTESKALASQPITAEEKQILDELNQADAQDRAGTLDVKIVAALPNGEYVIAINGVEGRWITAEHVRSILADRAEAKAAVEANGVLTLKVSRLENSLALAQKDASLADLQRALERERADKFQAMYQGEQGLRMQAESLKGGRVSAFFEKPAVQFVVKVGLPILGMVITGKR